MDFDFIKDQYLFELERKNQLRTSLNLPTGVLIVLGSLLGFFAKEFPYDLSTVITIIFFCLLGTSTILFLITVYHLIRSFYGRTYAFIETPGELKIYYDELLHHHRNLSDYYRSLEEYYGVEPRERDYPKPEVLAKQDFQEFLSQKYISATNENTWNNDSKSERLHSANLFLIFTLCSALVCSVPFLYADLNKPEKIHRIRINNVSEISLLEEKTMNRDTSPQSPSANLPSSNPQTNPPSSDLPKPPPPPENRMIKEGSIPEKRD